MKYVMGNKFKDIPHLISWVSGNNMVYWKNKVICGAFVLNMTFYTVMKAYYNQQILPAVKVGEYNGTNERTT